MKIALRVALAVGTLVLAFGACGGRTESTTQEAAPVKWDGCPEYIGGDLECASVDVPLDYAEPQGRTISIFLYRALGHAPANAKKGQVWFFQGGPGTPGTQFVRFFRDAVTQHPEWDYYTIDQRGTGNSTNLRCPENTADDVAGCAAALRAQWGDLSGFSTTNAANDIASMIDRMREPGKQVFVYGVSYGTFLLHRYLVLRPDQATGAILDSIAPPGFAYLDDFDPNVDTAARQVMDACSRDRQCQARLAAYAPDPWAAVQTMYARYDSHQLCPAFQAIARDVLRGALSSPITDSIGRLVMPAAVYRVLRCNVSDQKAIAHLVARSSGPEETSAVRARGLATNGDASFVEPSALESDVVQKTISLSELWRGTPLEQVQATEATLAFTGGVTSDLAELAATGVWPVYHDPNIDRRASTKMPMLMMNSTLDPRTPLESAQHIREIFGAPDQSLVAVPNAGHGVAFASPMKDAGALPCGQKFLFDFLANPEAPPDTSCLAGSYQLEWSGTSPEDRGASQTYLGTPDIWE